ncbi:MAG: type II toxin-antitoxin system RelE/ParE family toxin [Actinomycetaceae bacterium]|nr:type II toxin-antitoxin system RelE/ParE family toxin [Actinomycetaceae bacterium]
MTWTIRFTPEADKSFSKLDKAIQRRIVKKLRDVCSSGNPTASGKALTGDLVGFWRYRVGDYRLVCSIENDELIVLVVDIDHRSTVYKTQ